LQPHRVQVHSGHQGRYLQDPDADSSLGLLQPTTEIFIQLLTHVLICGLNMTFLISIIKENTFDHRTSSLTFSTLYTQLLGMQTKKGNVFKH